MDSFRDFHLTFNLNTYLKNIARYESIVMEKIFKENQIKLFLVLVLRFGVLSYQYNCSLGNSNNVCILGFNSGDKDRYGIRIIESAPKEIRVTIEGLGNLPNQKSVYAICYIPDQKFMRKVDLNRYNIPKGFLDSENLPLYINHPILGVYAKERLSGAIYAGSMEEHTYKSKTTTTISSQQSPPGDYPWGDKEAL
jgi:hypothetical protein